MLNESLSNSITDKLMSKCVNVKVLTSLQEIHRSKESMNYLAFILTTIEPQVWRMNVITFSNLNYPIVNL